MPAKTTTRPRPAVIKALSPIVTTSVGPDELTLAQAATRLGLTKTAVLKAVWAGTIPAVRREYPTSTAPVYFVTVSDVDASAQRKRVAGRAGKPGPRRKRTWSRTRKQPVEKIVAVS